MKSLRLSMLVVGLLFSGLNGLQAQVADNLNAIDEYFQNFVDDDRFSVVYISGKLFQMLGSLDKETVRMENDKDAEALIEIAQDMQGLRILSTDEDVDELYESAKKKINTSIYEPLMTVRGKDGDNMELLVRENKGKISELLLLSGGDEFVLMSFVGNLDMEKISKMAKEIEN